MFYICDSEPRDEYTEVRYYNNRFYHVVDTDDGSVDICEPYDLMQFENLGLEVRGLFDDNAFILTKEQATSPNYECFIKALKRFKHFATQCYYDDFEYSPSYKKDGVRSTRREGLVLTGTVWSYDACITADTPFLKADVNAVYQLTCNSRGSTEFSMRCYNYNDKKNEIDTVIALVVLSKEDSRSNYANSEDLHYVFTSVTALLKHISSVIHGNLVIKPKGVKKTS